MITDHKQRHEWCMCGFMEKYLRKVFASVSCASTVLHIFGMISQRNGYMQQLPVCRSSPEVQEANTIHEWLDVGICT